MPMAIHGQRTYSNSTVSQLRTGAVDGRSQPQRRIQATVSSATAEGIEARTKNSIRFTLTHGVWETSARIGSEYPSSRLAVNSRYQIGPKPSCKRAASGIR